MARGVQALELTRSFMGTTTCSSIAFQGPLQPSLPVPSIVGSHLGGQHDAVMVASQVQAQTPTDFGVRYQGGAYYHTVGKGLQRGERGVMVAVPARAAAAG